LEFLPNPNFYNTTADNIAYRAQKKRWFMADFYKCQRQRFNILMDGESPVGGQWSFDAHNRSKIAKQDLNKIPTLQFPAADDFDREAQDYVKRKFPDHPGEIDTLFYPTSHEAAQQWLDQFLNERLPLFGPYEDAMEQNQSWLWHGVLTPMLNIGLLNPRDVIAQAVEVAPTNGTPLNSLEGFVRQILGWREFMRATYEELGVTMRTTNFWNHHRPIPRSFYDGTTGIPPLDDTLLRLRKTGYCHHIERLMVLGGFMFLCEFDPDEIYKWFMEMFVDSYDWVMVPNVYAMSQNADGGLITTKPYFSGSAYIRKMSHYPAGDWCNVWDGLYWRWIHLHSEALGQNPRWAMMVSMCKKMPPEKRNGHLTTAESFLKSLAK
jgi:deoxyribodipyrimidine photolyase-related protein